MWRDRSAIVSKLAGAASTATRDATGTYSQGVPVETTRTGSLVSAIVSGKQPNAAVRFGSWLGQKVFGISRGVHELNAWVMKGVIQQVAKMDKSGANPNAVKEAIEEEKSNVLMIMSVEQVNTRSIEEMKAQAAMSQDGISQLAAKEKEGQ